MNERVFVFELEGKSVLGFDTGLNARSFAQAKLAQFITQPGFIVRPDGKIETWQSEGVTEYAAPLARIRTDGQDSSPGRETMIIWGPLFRGEEFADIIKNPNRKDEALDALRFWLKARTLLEKNLDAGNDPPFPGPAGAFIVTGGRDEYPKGTVFFPPARLRKRSLEAGGLSALPDAERFFHPDLENSEGTAFSAGVTLYTLFSGRLPFSGDSPEELRQNIREGNFIPPELASPGLDPELSSLISLALKGAAPEGDAVNRVSKKGGAVSVRPRSRPSPDLISGFIGAPAAKPVSAWIKPLSEGETAKIRAEEEKYAKKKTLSVKTRRFIIRNTAIIAGGAIALIILIFIVRDFAAARNQRPSTRGMTPFQVAETYYTAFNELDHTVMEACVSGGAGKGDIETAVNLYVVSKMRQAYEANRSPFTSAREWQESGRPETENSVFGITDLSIRLISEDAETALIEADYTLWLPAESPEGAVLHDALTLTLTKDLWRVTDISRVSR